MTDLHDYQLPQDCKDWEEFTTLPVDRRTAYLTEERNRRQYERIQNAHSNTPGHTSIEQIAGSFKQSMQDSLERLRRKRKAAGWLSLGDWR